MYSSVDKNMNRNIQETNSAFPLQHWPKMLSQFIRLDFGCAGSSSLCRLFSSCREQSLLSSCGVWAFHCNDISLLLAEDKLQSSQASVVVARGLSSCGSRCPEHWLNSCDILAQLLCGMWDLPGPGIEPMSPALAGRFFTTEALGTRGAQEYFSNINFKTILLIVFS